MANATIPQSNSWEKHEISIRESIRVLERAQAELLASDLSDDLRADAAREAQALSESLGALNMQQGSEFAHELARLLDSSQVLGMREMARIVRLVDLVKALVVALDQGFSAVA